MGVWSRASSRALRDWQLALNLVAWTIVRIKMQFATRGLLLCVALASAVHPTPRDIIMSSLPMKNDDSGEHIDIDWFDRDLTGHLHRNIMEHETESRGACALVFVSPKQG